MSRKLTRPQVKIFQHEILANYRRDPRDFPWRDYQAPDVPYRVYVSEVMLQQTQTARVAAKFPAFIETFPDFRALARAPLAKVLGAWQGMGYNRRAKYLREGAIRVVRGFGGALPADPGLLATLPGIGKNTAASICVYAYDLPVEFVETNIRAVYIHSFFKRRTKVSDDEILDLVGQTLYRRAPRRWFNALMDYGAQLKEHGNPAWKSASHRPPSRFEGSNRQIRGRVLALLLKGPCDTAEIVRSTGFPKDRVEAVLGQLAGEALVKRIVRGYSIA